MSAGSRLKAQGSGLKAQGAAGLGNIARVDVLPFHQLGRYKWERLGLRYELTDIGPPVPETTERICAVFRTAGLQAS